VPLVLEEATEFARRIASTLPEILLIGVALAVEDVAVLRSSTPDRTASERSTAIEHGIAPAQGGTILGHEVLGDGIVEAHSIICTGGEVDLARDLSVKFNANGLIEDLGDARRGAEWASQEGHAEPTQYFAWRLTGYEF
jgi:hypothetical protein